MLLTFSSLAFVLILLFSESFMIKRRINRLSVRIHINGTRGKSSVTEYVAAGLRTERRVIAKITGIKPTIIYEDGRKKIIKRNGRARVKEQLMMINIAAKNKVDCLVLECMSLLPELQKLESRVLKPHIYIITNIRDDHREEMGASTDEQAAAICSAIPFNSTVITSEEVYLPLIKETAAKRYSRVIYINSLEEKFRSFIPEGVFDINIALALTACRLSGVNEERALTSIINEINKKPGLLIDFKFNGTELKFVDGFAVNDVPSAKEFIMYWQNKFSESGETVVILNTRNDRPVRSIQFAEWIGKSGIFARVILTGTHIPRTRSGLLKTGFRSENITTWKKDELKNSYMSLKKIIRSDALVIGLGNIAGDGFLLLESLEKSWKENGN